MIQKMSDLIQNHPKLLTILFLILLFFGQASPVLANNAGVFNGP